MSEEIQLDSLLISLKRIFALPISKTTFKQVQNAVFTSITDPEERKAIFEALLTATFKEEPSEKHKRHVKKALLEEFSVPVRVAKEVEERGDAHHPLLADVDADDALFAALFADTCALAAACAASAPPVNPN